LRREIEDDFGLQALGEFLECLGADIQLVQLCGEREVVARPRGEVVHDVDLVAAREQRIDKGASR